MKILFSTVPAETPMQSWYPHLGVAYISSFLKKYSSHEIVLCDGAIGEPLFAKVRKENPDIIGFTFNTMNSMRAAETAHKLKQLFPDIPVICGGPHISFLSHKLPEAFDACVVGEGEQATLNLLDELEKNGKLTKKVYNAEQIKPLDRIPFPDRDLFNMKYYSRDQHHFPHHSGAGANVLTSRGCLFKCVFCPSSHFWKTMRFHSAEHVIDEIKLLVEKYGVHYINFWDDLFHANVKRLRKIVELFKKEKLDVKCGGQCHARLFNDEVAGLLKQMNFVYCGFGMESAVPRILKYLKCGATTVEDNYRAVRLCRKYDMMVGSGFILGSEGETEEDVQANVDFIKETKLDSYNFYTLTPYPGTPLWEEAKRKGIVSEDMDFSVLFMFFNPEVIFMNRQAMK